MTSRRCVLPSGGHPALAGNWWQSTRRTLACSAALILCIATSGQPLAAQTKQDFLTANIDSTVSPRDDFFQFANGAWLKRHPIPDDAMSWGIWNLVAEDIDSRLRSVNEVAASKKAPKGSLEQLIGDFWFAAMDTATINRQGLAPLKPDFDRIDRIHSTRDLIDVVALFHTRDYFIIPRRFGRALFAGLVEQDQHHSDRWIYSLSQGGISLGSQAYSATDAQRVKRRDAFREYLFKTFLRLQRDSSKARGSAGAVYELEAQLAKGFDQDDGYQTIGLTQLSRLTSTIDWTRYFRRIGATRVDSVNMGNPRFYQTLDSLLRSTPLETWKDYLRFWLVRVNSPFLDDSTFGEGWDYAGAAVTGLPHRGPRWQRVLRQEMNVLLGQPLARLFAKEYFPAPLKARDRAVAESIRDAFRARIEHLDWMSDSTKQRALLKLARLKITIGLPENPADFSTMPLRRDSYVLNVARASTWFHDLEMKKLNQPVDKTASDPGSQFSDDWYDRSNNEVLLGPEAVVQVPEWRDEALEDAIVYGAQILAHEISHAFDSEGRHYDADGNKGDWWTASDDAAFRERAQVLVDEYNELMPLDGVHVDGQRSLPENMADLVGLRIALDAFKKTEQFKKNERIGGFTPLQRFFLADAYGHMCHVRPRNLATTVPGAYAPCRERVNGVLMNIPEFYEAFDVKPGDRMYRPEDARVKIW
jgi:putative endopeptidase